MPEKVQYIIVSKYMSEKVQYQQSLAKNRSLKFNDAFTVSLCVTQHLLVNGTKGEKMQQKDTVLDI